MSTLPSNKGDVVMETDNVFIKIIIILIALFLGMNSNEVIRNDKVFVEKTNDYAIFSDKKENLPANKHLTPEKKSSTYLYEVKPLDKDTTVEVIDKNITDKDERVIAREFFDKEKKTSKKEETLYVLLKSSYELVADKPIQVKYYKNKKG